MARMARDSRLETREARRKLKQQHEPYWKQIHPGLFLGCRKGARGSVWFARRLVDGKYQKQKIGNVDDFQDANGKDVFDYKQAQRAALAYSDLPTETERRLTGTYTVQDAVDDYLDWFKAHRKSYTRTKQSIDAHIIPVLGKKDIKNLTTREIRKWHEKVAISPIRRSGSKIVREVDTDDPEAVRKRRSTANRVLNMLKAVLNNAWRDGHSESDQEWRKVKPFKNVDNAKIDWRSAKECKRLINAADPDFRLLIQAALLTGCRYGELISMKVNDYQPDSQNVYARETKNGKPRYIPLNDEGILFFDQITAGQENSKYMFLRKDGEPWLKSHQSRRMKDASKNAKIDPPISFHGLRNTYGALLAMEGVPMKVIAELMGHSDTRITEKHYAHINDDYVAKTLKSNLPSFGIKANNVKEMKNVK